MDLLPEDIRSRTAENISILKDIDIDKFEEAEEYLVTNAHKIWPEDVIRGVIDKTNVFVEKEMKNLTDNELNKLLLEEFSKLNKCGKLRVIEMASLLEFDPDYSQRGKQ